MRLVQQDKNETASLPVWLGRDVPHERELAHELLDQMGREKSLDYLLHLHDKEETRRQKRLQLYLAATWICMVALIATGGAFDWIALQSIWRVSHTGGHLHLPQTFMPTLWIWITALHTLRFWANGGKPKKNPLFSSTVQQNLVTTLLGHEANPLVADALCRATTYYTGDRTLLFERLAETLPLLPDDPEALTKSARGALASYKPPFTTIPFTGEKECRLLLRAAIKPYFARMGEPDTRLTRFLFGRGGG